MDEESRIYVLRWDAKNSEIFEQEMEQDEKSGEVKVRDQFQRLKREGQRYRDS